MLKDRRPGFQTPNHPRRTFPTRTTPTCLRVNRASRMTDTRSMLSTSRFSVAPRPDLVSGTGGLPAALPRQAQDFDGRNILLAALCAAVRRGGPPRISVVHIAMRGHGG